VSYYPLPIPYCLYPSFASQVTYRELGADPESFVIYWWSVNQRWLAAASEENIVVANGCVDLIARLDEGVIGFYATAKTTFEDRMPMAARWLGARLKPGAFYQLTKIPAERVMDGFVPLSAVFKDFQTKAFLRLEPAAQRAAFQKIIHFLSKDKIPHPLTSLFDRFANHPPANVSSLLNAYGITHQQAERVFSHWFGLSPAKILAILRFQRSLESLTIKTTEPKTVNPIAEFYRQQQFHHDFLHHLGITPDQLLAYYQKKNLQG
jgi:AraC-like DNA-binding protein